ISDRDWSSDVCSSDLYSLMSQDHLKLKYLFDRRPDQVEEIFELEMILAHQRIGRRYRGRRQARLHRGLRHQRMLDRIAGQDCNRSEERRVGKGGAKER